MNLVWKLGQLLSCAFSTDEMLEYLESNEYQGKATELSLGLITGVRRIVTAIDGDITQVVREEDEVRQKHGAPRQTLGVLPFADEETKGNLLKRLVPLLRLMETGSLEIDKHIASILIQTRVEIWEWSPRILFLGLAANNEVTCKRAEEEIKEQLRVIGSDMGPFLSRTLADKEGMGTDGTYWKLWRAAELVDEAEMNDLFRPLYQRAVALAAGEDLLDQEMVDPGVLAHIFAGLENHLTRFPKKERERMATAVGGREALHIYQRIIKEATNPADYFLAREAILNFMATFVRSFPQSVKRGELFFRELHEFLKSTKRGQLSQSSYARRLSEREAFEQIAKKIRPQKKHLKRYKRG